jgi:multiple sugar transport system ATP-binding protein
MARIVFDQVSMVYPGGVRAVDEPLSNLDAKLRVSMRASLAQLHARLGVTTVYVTHDQVEAMTLGQRVAVLREGRLQQADTPQVLFSAPVNLFVAGFIGSPAMNFADAQLVRDGGPAVTFAGHRLALPASLIGARPGLEAYFGKPVIVGIRPSDFEDAALAEPGWPRMAVTATVTEELGSEKLILFALDAPPVQHASLAAAETAPAEDDLLAVTGPKAIWTARAAARSPITPGQHATLAIDTTGLQFFDPDSGLSIGHAALLTV